MKYDLLGTASVIAVGAALGLAAPGTASAVGLSCSPGNIVGAGTCTETVALGLIPADLTNASIAIDKWVTNASAGFVENLTSVQFVFGGRFTAAGDLEGPNGNPTPFDFADHETFNFSGGSGAPANFPALGVNLDPSQTHYANAGDLIQVNGGEGAPYSVDFTVSPGTDSTVNSVLTGFMGAGTFDASVSTTETPGPTIPTNWTSDLTTKVAPSIEVTYNFTTSQSPVDAPEPASLGMLGAGLVQLGLIRRRRRRS